MPKSIQKYVLKFGTLIQIPKMAQIVDIREQHNQICMWALVDSKADHDLRKFIAYATGEMINQENLIFISTAHNSSGKPIHIFEQTIVSRTEQDQWWERHFRSFL